MPFLSKLLCSASLCFSFICILFYCPPTPPPVTLCAQLVCNWSICAQPGCDWWMWHQPQMIWSDTGVSHKTTVKRHKHSVVPINYKGSDMDTSVGKSDEKKKKCLVRESRSQYSWKIVFRMVNKLNKHVGEVKELIWNIIAVQYFFQNRAKTPVDACKTPGLSLCSSRHK